MDLLFQLLLDYWSTREPCAKNDRSLQGTRVILIGLERTVEEENVYRHKDVAYGA